MALTEMFHSESNVRMCGDLQDKMVLRAKFITLMISQHFPIHKNEKQNHLKKIC